MSNDFDVDFDDYMAEIKADVRNAVEFMKSEFPSRWRKQEKYYDGGVDLVAEEGKSKQVATVVRDQITAVLPSIMRTLLHSRRIVEYLPKNVLQADYVEMQSEFVTQDFWHNNGYVQLQSAIVEALVQDAGPMKVYREENPSPEYIKYTGLTLAEAEAHLEHPDVELISLNKAGYSDTLDEDLYDLETYRIYYNGKTVLEAFPIHELFVSSDATSLHSARVHGHRRDVSVSEAIEMGLDYPDWRDLKPYDVEEVEATSASNYRRGYQKRDPRRLESTADLLQHKFLLSEAYIWGDLDNTGVTSRYRVWLGGTQYVYLDHERLESFPIHVVLTDIRRFSVIGRALAGILISTQDTGTSLLRATIDNAHAVNNPRLYADPTVVDFDDLLNQTVGAPVRTRGDVAPRPVTVPSTLQEMLPVLEYINKEGEIKTGATKAATGLDPDAMQSTDKEAVKNTIALSQGQVELMVRNIIETALIPIFREMLRIRIRHSDRVQVMKYKGVLIPVDISQFDPDLPAEPNVGLGTANVEQKVSTLMFIHGEQQRIIAQFGLDNPFVSLQNVYSTLEDLCSLGGIHNVGKYFTVVTPQVEQQIAELLKQQAAAAAEAENNKTIDPSQALISIEQIKARTKQMEIMARKASEDADRSLQAQVHANKDDLDRDTLEVNKHLEVMKLKLAPAARVEVLTELGEVTSANDGEQDDE